jgi:hypothetical protein
LERIEITEERKTKEINSLKFIDIKNHSGIAIRVFKDGTAYELSGHGGRYCKYAATGVWDYDLPGSSYPLSHADKQFEKENEILTEAWKTLQ